MPIWIPPTILEAVSGGNDAFTKLLLHFEGADASTTFTNSSASAHTVTASGNAQIDTAQFKFGSASALFDGAGDYLSLDGSSDFAAGTGDFAIDLWVRIAATGVYHYLYDGRPSGTGSGAYNSIYVNSSNSLEYYANGGTRITGTTALTTGAWYHVALTRSGTSTKLFLNGTQEGSTYSDSTNYTIGTSRPMIGVSGFDGSGSPLNGWIDELRVSKGAARWTANFTPPSAAYF
jgi:hypothetical protein